MTKVCAMGILFNTSAATWAFIVSVGVGLVQSNLMKCSYGDRGSLTVYCTNATSLYFKMTSYPFDHLDETLKCVNCTLTLLLSGMFDIAANQLKIVDLRNSSITQIMSQAFVGLMYMEQLLLSDNPIQSIAPGAFIGIRKLKYLELENAISHLDIHGFVGLSVLEILNLSRNNLTKLENGSLDGLHNLRTLDISFNELKKLDNVFHHLVNLRSLRLSNNQLYDISGDSFQNLRNLILLNLDGNNISQFSIRMDSTNKLRQLNLARNLLNSSGIKIGSFKDLTSLEELDLSQNEFTTIPPKFFQGLLRLSILNLQGNKIIRFSSGTFSGVPHLRRLNISYNHLETANVSGRLLLNNLHTLDLSNNYLKDFDYIDFIARMPKLTYVNLFGNYLTCDTADEIRTLFMEDNIQFIISYSGNDSNCMNSTHYIHKTAMEIVQMLIGAKSRESQAGGSETIWIVLMCIVVILLGILFFIQFFILNRIQPASSNFRLVSNSAFDN